jgi:AcrR family transcriptional regulator
MTAVARSPLSPRKTPVQARSVLTVEAIMEATIQVLQTHGTDRLTTTRVAERAGVSIGTLYQYYPNKRSLLFGLLEQKLEDVAAALEAACREAYGTSLAAMMRHIVERFVDAKMGRADISTALYRISADVGGPEIVKRAEARSRVALEAALATASDLHGKVDPFAVSLMLAAMSGATRSVLEAGAPASMVRQLRDHLILLFESYVKALPNSR